MNCSTPRLIHTPSNLIWITVAILDFPGSGIPFSVMALPNLSKYTPPRYLFLLRLCY